MRLVLTAEARDDIAQAVRWYRERSVRAAEEFLSGIGKTLARIETQPTAQVVVDRESGARRALLRRFPHRVLYLIDGDRIVVFAVMHRRRDDPVWRDRLR